MNGSDLRSLFLLPMTSSGYQGEDMEGIVALMDHFVVKVHADRIKELMILHGKRSKKISIE